VKPIPQPLLTKIQSHLFIISLEQDIPAPFIDQFINAIMVGILLSLLPLLGLVLGFAQTPPRTIRAYTAPNCNSCLPSGDYPSTKQFPRCDKWATSWFAGAEVPGGNGCKSAQNWLFTPRVLTWVYTQSSGTSLTPSRAVRLLSIRLSRRLITCKHAEWLLSKHHMLAATLVLCQAALWSQLVVALAARTLVWRVSRDVQLVGRMVFSLS
jgi:hypothetical protein